MKILSKKIQKKLSFFLATKLGWLFIIGWCKMLFIKEKGRKFVNQAIAENKNYIYVLWHGRILVPIFIHRNKGICPLVSLHSDGEMIAQSLHKLGYQTVRGSSTRGGREAFHEMVGQVKKGVVGTMIPDGPQGPRHHLKPGTLYMAQQTGAYLIPATFSAKRKIMFNSWDRFFLPLPFSKTLMLYGKPITVPRNISPRELVKIRSDFELRMINLEKNADAYFR